MLLPITSFPAGFGDQKILPNSLHEIMEDNDEDNDEIMNNGKIVCICADQSLDDLHDLSNRKIRVHAKTLRCNCEEKFTETNTINIKNIDVDSYSAGEVVLNPNDETIMNGFSTMKDINGKSLVLPKGFKLIVCKNQYIDKCNYMGKDKLGEKTLRCHFVTDRTGHHSDCSCGRCDYRYNLREHSFCPCIQQEPIDPGKEQCIVM